MPRFDAADREQRGTQTSGRGLLEGVEQPLFNLLTGARPSPWTNSKGQQTDSGGSPLAQVLPPPQDAPANAAEAWAKGLRQQAELVAGIAAYRAGGHDGVICFGGGSALDLGKMIALMAHQRAELSVWDLEDIDEAPVEIIRPQPLQRIGAGGVGEAGGNSGRARRLDQIGIDVDRDIGLAVLGQQTVLWRLGESGTADEGRAIPHTVSVSYNEAGRWLDGGETVENVPLGEDIEAYFKREVLPHASDAWIDYEKTKVGYEIPFNRHFYVFKPPRPLAEIDAELKQTTDRILDMIKGLSA